MNARRLGLPNRILIYGVTGSGKTHLARRLSELSGIPFHGADDLTWEPGWVQVSDEEQRKRVEAVCASPRWILDSAYAKWADFPVEGADLIIALDYNRAVSLTRLIGRTWRRVVDKQPVCNGNFETLKLALSRDSIIVWHFKSFKRKRARIRKWEGEMEPGRLLRFTKPNQVEEWLDTLTRR